jgi:hypothetical protein
MKTNQIGLLLLLFAATIIFNTGCKKDDNKEDQTKETSVDQGLVLAERTFNDIGNFTSSAFSEGKGKLKSGETTLLQGANCLVITFDLTSSPYKMVLDFGNTNCLCIDGIYRRGKIVVSYTASYGDSLASLNTTFDNFFVNDNQISGTRILTYKGHNQTGHPNWDVTIDGSIVLASGEGTITYQSSHNSEMIEGELTPALSDNVFSITGSANGTSITGQAFSSVITTPLISKMTCGHFVSGVVEITPAAQPMRILNYGTGECDNKATVTVSGITFEITLP